MGYRAFALMWSIVGLLAVAVFPQEKPVSVKPKDPPISEEYKKKWTLDPAKADPRWQKAARLRFNGDVEGAIALYETFLEENADEISVVVSLGMAHWERGALDEAEKWLWQGKALRPKHIKARQFLGQLLLHRGRFAQAQKEFEELLALEWNRPDVVASAHLNLGRIALVKRDWKRADHHFFETGKSPENGDRHTAEKGRGLVQRYKRTFMWPKVETEHLQVWFSPVARDARSPATRKDWAAGREKAYRRISRLLGITFPERLVVYCYRDDVDAFSITGEEDLHSWKYSWWIISDSWTESPGHQLAHQMVSRIGGGRPANKILVEGLCCYVDGDPEDPHAAARALLKRGRLKSLGALHVDQSYRLSTAKPYGASFVAWLIDAHGMEAFKRSYVAYNNVLRNQAWVRSTNLNYRWAEALSEVFVRGTGDGLDTLEGGWRAFLAR